MHRGRNEQREPGKRSHSRRTVPCVIGGDETGPPELRINSGCRLSSPRGWGTGGVRIRTGQPPCAPVRMSSRGSSTTEGPWSNHALLLRGPSGRYRSPRDDKGAVRCAAARRVGTAHHSPAARRAGQRWAVPTLRLGDAVVVIPKRTREGSRDGESLANPRSLLFATAPLGMTKVSAAGRFFPIRITSKQQARAAGATSDPPRPDHRPVRGRGRRLLDFGQPQDAAVIPPGARRRAGDHRLLPRTARRRANSSLQRPGLLRQRGGANLLDPPRVDPARTVAALPVRPHRGRSGRRRRIRRCSEALIRARKVRSKDALRRLGAAGARAATRLLRIRVAWRESRAVHGPGARNEGASRLRYVGGGARFRPRQAFLRRRFGRRRRGGRRNRSCRASGTVVPPVRSRRADPSPATACRTRRAPTTRGSSATSKRG
jgi:hypothetical protein